MMLLAFAAGIKEMLRSTANLLLLLLLLLLKGEC